jgi:uncharacterized membrane protein YhaH (DUF805 family)
MSMTRLFFSFEGRMSRQPYWLATTVVTAVMFVVTVILYNVVDDCVKIGTFVLLLALFIPFFWSTLALSAKRLHDRNKSARWLFTFYLLPPILKRFAEGAGGSGSCCCSRAPRFRSGPLSSSVFCAARPARTTTVRIR